jgi:hypothetical protein
MLYSTRSLARIVFADTTSGAREHGPQDTAVGRAYIAEFGRMRDGSSHLNYSVYHDRYERTSDGWKFAERVYEVRYLDTTPLAGSAHHAAVGVDSSEASHGFSARGHPTIGRDRSFT